MSGGTGAKKHPARHGGLFEQLNQVVGEDWRFDALCQETDPEAFFPEKSGSTREAKLICQQCDVSDECLADAFACDEQFGIRGGLTARERREITAGRGAAA